jgi:hypothetical protein
MNSNKYHFFFLISIFYVFMSLILKNQYLFYGYSVFILIYALLDFKLGVSSWVLISLLTGISGNDLVSLLYSFILIFAFFIKITLKKEIFIKTAFLNYLLLFIFLLFSSMLLSGYLDYFHVLIEYIFIFFISYILSQQIISDKENLFLISNAFIISAFLAIVSTILTGEGINRLGLGDSVRQLSNILGIGLVFLISIYYFGYKPKKNKKAILQFNFINNIKLFLSIFLLLGLLFTVSRGSIIASISSILLLIGCKFLSNIKTISIIKFLIIIFLMIFILNIYSEYIYGFFNLNFEILFKRFSAENLEDGSGIREQIWKAGISGLDGGQVFYGHGISSFRMLAMKNGYDFYAHSLFVDTLVTTGVLGLVLLIFILLRILILNFKLSDLLVYSLLCFLVLNYITHGTMKSQGFWYILGICSGIIYSGTRNICPSKEQVLNSGNNSQ